MEEKKELSIIKGLGPSTLLKLEENGICSLMTLAVSSPKDLSSLCGISETAARKFVQQARKSLKLGFEVAKDFAKKRDKIQKIGRAHV